jgi:hypothetical protein
MSWAKHEVLWKRGEVDTGFWWGNQRERHHLENPSLDGRIISKWIFWKWDGDMDWIDVTQERDRSRALVNAVMNLRIQ